MSHSEGKRTFRPSVRFAAGAGVFVVLALLTWTAGCAGFGSLLTSYAANAGVIASADAAVTLSPDDPDARLVRGELFETNHDLSSAISEYQMATALRPGDYVLWLSLARARELNGQSDAAIAAARKAVPLAPFYAEPHWQLGNILLRAGQRDEAFKELSLAGASNPVLLPAIMDLAWQLSNGDARFVLRTVNPQTAESSRMLGDYFGKRGAVTEAIAMLSVAGRDAEAVRVRLQYVSELISQHRFKDAYQLWTIDQTDQKDPGNAVGVIVDPGFEQESNLDGPGFSWRTANKSPAIKLTLDSAAANAGQTSLRVDFSGDSDQGEPIISQLLLIEPKTHYQLRFAFRTEEIVSGGLPNLRVVDARTNNLVGQSGVLPRATSGWREMTIDFLSGEGTVGDGAALKILLNREPCGVSPCPIFGRLWLDSFSLQKQ